MSYLDRFDKIKALVFDIDGVLTDGRVLVMANGEQLRYTHSKDAYALQLAVKQGYQVGVITGGNSIAMKERLMGLGITDIYLKSSDKEESIKDFKFSHHLEFEEIMYMGDDIPDLCALQHVGVAACPEDASVEVKKVSHFISQQNGGQGCVREIIELIMRAQGSWYDQENNPSNYADFAW